MDKNNSLIGKVIGRSKCNARIRAKRGEKEREKFLSISPRFFSFNPPWTFVRLSFLSCLLILFIIIYYLLFICLYIYLCIIYEYSIFDDNLFSLSPISFHKISLSLSFPFLHLYFFQLTRIKY